MKYDPFALLLPASRHRHPATTWNQKKIWEAEQADLKRKKDEAAANKELKRDSDRRFYENLAGGKQQDASSAALNFMYNPPPGYQQVSGPCGVGAPCTINPPKVVTGGTWGMK